jgi:hypothetical protein
VSAARLNKDDVLAALNVEDVIRHGDLKVTNGGGSQHRLSECPRCHEKSGSKAIAIDKRSGAWLHHGRERGAGGECSGDLLDLLAAIEGLDSRRDFVELVECAARIAGVEARPFTEEERAERRAHRERVTAERQQAAEREEAMMLREAKLKASSTWQRHGRNRETRTCRAYLNHRGLDGAHLVGEDYARSDMPGNVCVPLWSLDDSDLVNVVSRIVSEKNAGPKVLGLAGCPTAGTLCGRVAEITNGASVIIAEGVIDTLTAIHRWPGRVVLGAHGAGRMTRIVETVAPIVLAKGGKLVLVPDGDDVGQRCAIKAGEAALAAGLEMDRTLIVLDLGGYKDLNEAHCAGWKP